MRCGFGYGYFVCTYMYYFKKYCMNDFIHIHFSTLVTNAFCHSILQRYFLPRALSTSYLKSLFIFMDRTKDNKEYLVYCQSYVME